MMKYMIGADIGTTSTKAVLYDLKGNVKAYANVGYHLYQKYLIWRKKIQMKSSKLLWKYWEK